MHARAVVGNFSYLPRTTRVLTREKEGLGTRLSQGMCLTVNNTFLHTLATEMSVDIEELVDDFVTFYVAGQEITASVLTFALVLTLQHPNVLERYSNYNNHSEIHS